MNSKTKKIDRVFLFTVISLISIGLVIFLSAALGLLARDGIKLGSVAFNQIFFGIFLGGIVCFIVSNIDYKIWSRASLWLYIISIILAFAVFIPGVGIEFNGARRWILLGPISFQPAELLKISYILFLATWFSGFRNEIKTFKYGLLPFLIISGLAAAPLFFQPDNDTILIMVLSGFAMFFAGGMSKKHFITIFTLGVIFAGIVLTMRPYVLDRIKTFINPGENAQTSGYQIQQSLIAIGSGGFFGKGFGQSIQKFNYLPEPISDSIFAVASEEFGFLGSVLITGLFLLLLIRGIQLAIRSPDTFGGLFIIGIVIMIASQSFLNIASMLGLFPLSGLPLLFISKGGTALFFTLFAIGIIFNISKHKKI